MTTIVCVPIHRIKCKVHVDQGRAWTAVEELVLAAIAQQPASIAELSHASITASDYRLRDCEAYALPVRSG